MPACRGCRSSPSRGNDPHKPSVVSRYERDIISSRSLIAPVPKFHCIAVKRCVRGSHLFCHVETCILDLPQGWLPTVRVIRVPRHYFNVTRAHLAGEGQLENLSLEDEEHRGIKVETAEWAELATPPGGTAPIALT